MNDSLDSLSPQCHEVLQQQLEHLIALRGWKPDSLDGLASRWQSFVMLVSGGYENLWLDDYQNDRYVRTILQDLIDYSPNKCSAELVAALRPIDGEFMSLTVEVRWSFGATPSWCNRVPKQPWPGLRDDLTANGLI